MDPTSPRAANPGPLPPRVKLWKITNVVLKVADLERSVAFYAELLGMVVRARVPGMAHMDAGSVTLSLCQPAPGLPVAVTDQSEIVFESHDVRAAHSWLRARGVILGEPRVAKSENGRDLLVAHFRDPDGHLLSITGWESARAHRPVVAPRPGPPPVSTEDLKHRG